MYADDPARAARAASDAVRELNHATIHRHGYAWPADVDTVISELHLVAERMDQALRQASGWLEHAHALGGLGHDRDGNPGTLIHDLADRFAASQAAAGQLTATLTHLREITCHLTAPPTSHLDEHHPADLPGTQLAPEGL